MSSPKSAGSKSAASPRAATSPPRVGQESSLPAAGHLSLEADNQYPENDADSFYSPDAGSATTSLSASIWQYRVENGRTYHSFKADAVDYFMPNDEVENDRLDLQHALMLMLYDNQLYLCPAGKEKPLMHVLDAGCGTGIWSMDLADAFPQASVTGVDISPIQPRDVPPNLEFIIDDIEVEWTFSKTFDLINFRMLSGSIKDYPKLFSRAFNQLSPGGYVEICEIMAPIKCDDGTLPEDSALVKWDKWLVEASRMAGRPLSMIAGHKQRMIDAGYTNVVEVVDKWPINSWPKDRKYKHVGAWVQQNMLDAVESLSLMIFTNVLGWSRAEVDVFLVDVRKDLKNRQIHAYWPIYTVYGQKPE